jgi:hypothetical protein
MAGTIVSDTTQDGAGNSIATTTVIKGSAQAWINFTYISSTLTTTSSFNISSITRSAAGQYSITFSTALTDANYAVVQACGSITSQNTAVNAHQHYNVASGAYITPTASSFSVGVINEAGNAAVDPYVCSIVVHR